MTEDRGQRTENYRRCQAITTKGRRCRKKADYYRIHEGDRLEYLCCKIHFQNFRPHPGQKGQQPPKEAM
jgi:hypothetical protein